MAAHAILEETNRLDFPGKVSEELKAVLRRCLAPRRDDRPDVQSLLDDVYFTRAAK